jgi:tRNA uridine 5-carboxymethylaminomethyl modification enzyme
MLLPPAWPGGSRVPDFRVGRMKTGTVPRLDAKSIDFSNWKPSTAMIRPASFLLSTEGPPPLEQRPCHITYTNATEPTGSSAAPLTSHPCMPASSRASAPGTAHRSRTRSCVSGKAPPPDIPWSLKVWTRWKSIPTAFPPACPLQTQINMVRSIAGLERARIIRPGYAIEYDYVDPLELKPSLETKTGGGTSFSPAR